MSKKIPRYSLKNTKRFRVKFKKKYSEKIFNNSFIRIRFYFDSPEKNVIKKLLNGIGEKKP